MDKQTEKAVLRRLESLEKKFIKSQEVNATPEEDSAEGQHQQPHGELSPPIKRLNLIPPESHGKAPTQKTQQFKKWIKGNALSVASIIVLILYTGATFEQVSIASKAIDESGKQFKIGTRAYVLVNSTIAIAMSDFSTKIDDSNIRTEALGEVNRFGFTSFINVALTVVNSGQTPASRIHLTRNVRTIEKWQITEGFLNKESDNKPDPNAWTVLGKDIPFTVNYRLVSMDKDLKLLRSGDEVIVAWGTIEYFDIFGQKRSTAYCKELLHPTLIFQDCPVHNRID